MVGEVRIGKCSKELERNTITTARLTSFAGVKNITNLLSGNERRMGQRRVGSEDAQREIGGWRSAGVYFKEKCWRS